MFVAEEESQFIGSLSVYRMLLLGDKEDGWEAGGDCGFV